MMQDVPSGSRRKQQRDIDGHGEMTLDAGTVNSPGFAVAKAICGDHDWRKLVVNISAAHKCQQVRIDLVSMRSRDTVRRALISIQRTVL